MSVHNHDEETIKKLQEQTAFDKKNRAKTSESGQGGVARNQVSPPSFDPIAAYKERLKAKVEHRTLGLQKALKDCYPIIQQRLRVQCMIDENERLLTLLKETD